MTQKTLEQKVRKFEKTIERGDSIELQYEGETIERYDFFEYSLDSKTPVDWLRGALCFEVMMKDRDIDKVTLKFNKTQNIQIGNCMITIL